MSSRHPGLLLAFLALTAGCDPSDPTDVVSLPGDTDDEALPDEAVVAITPEGGSVVVDGARLDIPAGALAETVEVSLAVHLTPTALDPALSDAALAKAARAITPFVDAGPDGLTFAVPVTLTVDGLTGAPDTGEVSMVWASHHPTVGEQAVVHGATLDDGAVVVELTHFSAGYGLSGTPTEDPFCDDVAPSGAPLDNDGDGLANCDDPDCATAPACTGDTDPTVDSLVVDTAPAADTAVPPDDTFVVDTAGPTDTLVVDTAGPIDTFVPLDTGPTDTFVPLDTASDDTVAAVDTLTVDTAPPGADTLVVDTAPIDTSTALDTGAEDTHFSTDTADTAATDTAATDTADTWTDGDTVDTWGP